MLVSCSEWILLKYKHFFLRHVIGNVGQWHINLASQNATVFAFVIACEQTSYPPISTEEPAMVAELQT